jgi:hypothetical protein
VPEPGLREIWIIVGLTLLALGFFGGLMVYFLNRLDK